MKKSKLLRGLMALVVMILLVTPVVLIAQADPGGETTQITLDLVDLIDQAPWFQKILAYMSAIVAVLFVLDKIVKLTPTPYDDAVVSFLLWLARLLRGTKSGTPPKQKGG